MPFYSVRTNPARGIYTKWEDCKKAISKCSQDVQVSFKKFDTKKEAEEFLNANCGANKKSKYRYSLYVDGSYDKEYKVASYAAILVDEKSNSIVDKTSGVCKWKANSWNIDGELTAVIKGIRMILYKGYTNEVNIYFDYEGIRSYAKGWYAPNNCAIAKHYLNFLNIIKAKINLHFVKVKSHSNNKLNDVADILAKKAIKNYKRKIKKLDKISKVEKLQTQEILPKKQVLPKIKESYIYLLGNTLNDKVVVGVRTNPIDKNTIINEIMNKGEKGQPLLFKALNDIGSNNLIVKSIQKINYTDNTNKKAILGKILIEHGGKLLLDYQSKYIKIAKESEKKLTNNICKKDSNKEEKNSMGIQETFEILILNNENKRKTEHTNLTMLNNNLMNQYNDEYIQLAE